MIFLDLALNVSWHFSNMALEFLKFLTAIALVSYKPVSYKRKDVYTVKDLYQVALALTDSKEHTKLSANRPEYKTIWNY